MATKDFKLIQTDEPGLWATFNDIAISNGDIVLIEGENKIKQEIVKFILTQIGTTLLFPNYGTNIPFLMNNRVSNNLYDDLKNEIIYGCKYVQSINLNETINIAKIVSVNFETPDPRELSINIELLLTNGNTLLLTESLTI